MNSFFTMNGFLSWTRTNHEQKLISWFSSLNKNKVMNSFFLPWTDSYGEWFLAWTEFYHEQKFVLNGFYHEHILMGIYRDHKVIRELQKVIKIMFWYERLLDWIEFLYYFHVSECWKPRLNARLALRLNVHDADYK
jgi:hypothetical protein